MKRTANYQRVLCQIQIFGWPGLEGEARNPGAHRGFPSVQPRPPNPNSWHCQCTRADKSPAGQGLKPERQLSRPLKIMLRVVDSILCQKRWLYLSWLERQIVDLKVTGSSPVSHPDRVV